MQPRDPCLPWRGKFLCEIIAFYKGGGLWALKSDGLGAGDEQAGDDEGDGVEEWQAPDAFPSNPTPGRPGPGQGWCLEGGMAAGAPPHTLPVYPFYLDVHLYPLSFFFYNKQVSVLP